LTETWPGGGLQGGHVWNYYAHMVPGQMTILRGQHNLHEKDCKEGKPKPLRGTGAHPERTGCSRSEHSTAGGRWRQAV